MQIPKVSNGWLESLFRIMARYPLISLAVLLALQTVFMLDSRALWFSDEIRYADVFENLVHEGKWLVLYLNDQFYPDKPPVFFWLLAALRWSTGLEGPPLLFLGAAVTGYCFLAATIWMGRRVLGLSRETQLAAGLVLLTTPYFVGLAHYVRMDLLFGALILCSQVCLFEVWQRDSVDKRSLAWAMAGMLLAAVAALTKGPLGVAFPVLGSLAWLAWTRNLGRFFRRDVAYAALAAGAVLLLWFAAALVVERAAYIQNILYEQIYRRATNTWHHEQPFYHYFLTLPGAFLPWTLLLLTLPLQRLVRKSFWQNVLETRGARHQGRERAGLIYCWALLISGFVLLSVVSIKIVVYLLPLFAPLALFTARRLAEDPERQSARLFLAFAVLFGALGLVLPFANLLHPWPISIEGTLLCGGGLLLLALLLWRWAPRDDWRAGLLFTALGLTIWLQPAGLRLAPSLDPIMSPKAQAELMREFIHKGHYPLAYKVYSGTYTYYAGQAIHETGDMKELEQELALRPKAVVGMRRKYWDEWGNRPPSLELVHEQWIADRPFVLAVQGGEEGVSTQN
jgi:4-amino-4-deoxy-L-arabinose transferase-like glycosyltransferase